MQDYEGEELSDTEDPDLLSELEGIQEEEEEERPRHAAPARQAARQEDEEGVGHSLLQTVRDRLLLYKEAEQVGEHSERERHL